MPRASSTSTPDRSQMAGRGGYLRDNLATRLDEAVTPMSNAAARDRRDRSDYRY